MAKEVVFLELILLLFNQIQMYKVHNHLSIKVIYIPLFPEDLLLSLSKPHPYLLSSNPKKNFHLFYDVNVLVLMSIQITFL